MAQSRYYSATAQPTILTADLTPSQTNVQVQQTVGFPVTTPFILALGYGTASEEIVLVTNQAGLVLTCTRGYDGTAATNHTAGDAVRHTWTAMDGNDSRAHEGSTSGVHGVTGNVVGTIDTQTLTNKTLTSPTMGGTATFTGTPAFQAGFNAGASNQMSVNSSGVMTTGSVDLSTGTLRSASGIGAVTFAIKPSDQIVSNSTTLANDTALLLPVVANATYQLSGLLDWTATTVADIKIQWTAPAGTVMAWNGFAQDTTATGAVGTIITGRSSLASVQAYGGRGAGLDTTALLAGLVVVGGTPGTLQLQFAQNTAEVSNTTMRANSFIRLDRIA